MASPGTYVTEMSGYSLNPAKQPIRDRTGWLGRQDSNLRMPVPKTGALPLGDAPRATRQIQYPARAESVI